MYTEDQFIPVSAMQHFIFCARQCGLIHLESAWAENRLTAEGRLLHERVHDSGTENRPGLRIVRGLRVHSFELGLVGQADVVEFHESDDGIRLPDTAGLWQPFPVEYKRGKPKKDRSDSVQLCAQAMCLEEMLDTTVPTGTFFYGKTKRRTNIEFDGSLRDKVRRTAQDVHAMLQAGSTPRARYRKKCDNCSLYTQCMPKATGPNKNIDLYLAKAFEPPLLEQ